MSDFLDLCKNYPTVKYSFDHKADALIKVQAYWGWNIKFYIMLSQKILE